MVNAQGYPAGAINFCPRCGSRKTIMVNAQGYPAGAINYCPRCGSSNIEYNDHWNDGDGLLKCICGCRVIIVADDNDGGVD